MAQWAKALALKAYHRIQPQEPTYVWKQKTNP